MTKNAKEKLQVLLKDYLKGWKLRKKLNVLHARNEDQLIELSEDVSDSLKELDGQGEHYYESPIH